MKLIGLTGTTGSGKGYVSALFACNGILSVDTDGIVHRLYREDQSCIDLLTKEFGDIRAEDGSIDRKKLSTIVFADRSRLATLNQIVHQLVKAEVEKLSMLHAQKGEEYLLIDAPQLYEAGMEKICHKVIAVVAPTELRIARICARDGITREAAEARIAAQHTDAFFEATADFVICNDGVQSVSEQVDRIMGELNNGKTQTD